MLGIPVGKTGHLTVGHMMREMICEGVDHSVLQEDGEKSYYLEGIFMQGDVINNNKRIYPTEVLDVAVQGYQVEKIDKRTSYGELNHPDSPRINLDKAAILVQSLTKRGIDFYGKAKVCHEDCPMGKILRGLLKTGGAVGVSSRGLGSANPITREGQECNLVDSFNLRAIDCVSDPSAEKAMVEAFREEKQYILDDSTGAVIELNEETYKVFEKQLKVLPVKKVAQDAQVYNAVKNFLNGLHTNPK